MNEERDRFLTECMGTCWHDYDIDKPVNTYSLEAYICEKCKGFILGNNNFSDEEDFMRLLKWAKEQKYLEDFLARFDEEGFRGAEKGRENRNKLADALYSHLKEHK